MPYPNAGLHPVQATASGEDGAPGCRSATLEELPPVLDFIRSNADRLVAVGEVGLDFSPHVLRNDLLMAGPGGNEAAKAAQRLIFEQQIALAMELGLPLNVHSRSAGHHAIDCLIRCGTTSALLHAFDGKLQHAVRGAAAGRGRFFCRV